MGDRDRLSVFVSSTMAELRDLRDVVRNELKKQEILGHVYEAETGAAPESVRRTSFEQLRNADLYLGLFSKQFGQVTAEEYFLAKHENKPRFIYIRGTPDTKRDPELEEFLRQQVYNLDARVTYAFFDEASALAEQIPVDILNWLVRQHRKAAERNRETQGMREDENASFAQAERALADILGLVGRALDDGRKLKLAAAQEQWREYCTANAEFMADDARYGTLSRLMRISALTEMTKARTAELWKGLGL